jgi:hypothetical protein
MLCSLGPPLHREWQHQDETMRLGSSDDVTVRAVQCRSGLQVRTRKGFHVD